MTELYKAYRIIDEKPRWIIVDDTGKIVNKNPNEEELKGMVKFIEKDGRSNKKYTDRGLLNYLIKFEKENERPPTARDFINNREYPGCRIYFDRFGSWQKALKLVGLDFEAMVKKGILKNEHQKARLSEIIIRDHFKNKPMDLSGDKCDNPCDGICPNGKTYEVKSSKLFEKIFWVWSTKNKYKEEIEFYYLLAFNKDWTRLEQEYLER